MKERLDPADQEDDQIRSSWERVWSRDEFLDWKWWLMEQDLQLYASDSPEKREGIRLAWFGFIDLTEKGILECLETPNKISFRITEHGRSLRERGLLERAVRG